MRSTAAVETLDLRVQHVDEAPHQGLALVCELCAVDGDAVHHDADGLAEGVDGVVLVPDLAAVELAALRCCAEGGDVLADGCGCGSGCGVAADVEHDALLSVSSSGTVHPVVIALWDTRAQRNHLALEGLRRELVRKVADVGAEVGVLAAWEAGAQRSS